MTPYEIALRHTRPLTSDEVRQEMHDQYVGKEMPDPCPADLRELNEMDQRIAAQGMMGRQPDPE